MTNSFGNRNQAIYMKVDPDTLLPIWVNKIGYSGANGAVEIQGIATDSNGNVVLSGYLSSGR